MRFRYLLLLFSFFINLAFSEPRELFIKNGSSVNIAIKIYPVGFIFNGNKEYNFNSIRGIQEHPYITGEYFEDVEPYTSRDFEHDAFNHEEDLVEIDGMVGYGKYRIDFYEKISDSPPTYDFKNYCYVDYSHGNYPWNPLPNGLSNDIYVHYLGNGDIRGWDYINLPDDRTLKIWDQRRTTVPNAYEPQNKSGFHSTNSGTNFQWLNFPLIASEYQGPAEETPEKCFVNLTLTTNNFGKVVCGRNFELTPGNMFIVENSTNSGTEFFIGDADNNSSCNATFKMTTTNSSFPSLLWLKANTEFIVRNGSGLYLNNFSKVRFDDNSKIIMRNGSRLCLTGYIRFYGPGYNNGSLVIQGHVIKSCSDPGITTPIFEDSAKLVIDTNSVLELPDSTFITFKGSETKLICKENSMIKFGKGSKLIFEDGARISANGCKFVSYDSTQTWDGIYLSDDANDTIKNCVIQNAYNGINISEPSSISLTNYTTEITNCTFKNSTSTQLLNQVYIDGANGVLVKGCSTVSGISSGFASCIVMQYCPSGSVVIADNTFSNCDIGITAIQSSPYIARNIITGLTGTGTGLYLDNSNGTIEYNIVNNFEKSIECGYSSPYLLKNTFNDASDMIVQLYSASVPVMRPVNSGTVTRWLGGNNTLSGTPTTGAFVLEKESYPMMDSGYNKILTNGYNYVSGELDGDLEAGMNHWQDNPPNTAYYAVSGGEVIYDPVFNGTSLPTMDYYDLNSIGFGMYDSVFVIDNGDNPLAGSLFMQAYTSEMSGNYSTAITKYKDVVIEYKTSIYATVSLARIFNCLEKNNSSVSDYSNIQSYYASIRNDTNNTKESREISEDFVTKSKVRQGNIMEAVSDYENIYQNNQNTHKGTHALLNKLCLLKYGSGGDNPNSSSSTESKINILSLISGKSLNQNISNNINNTPQIFKLHQNYPNPFNPTTNIRYEIPRDANVSIKVYDLLGREVFNVNEYKQAGSHEVMFDGSKLASGLYFYSLVTYGFKDTKKMVLIK